MLGNGITLQNSTVNSDIQSSIHSHMKDLILNSYDGRISQRLNLLQEEVSFEQFYCFVILNFNHSDLIVIG